ncbi:MAG TPA: serine/threonine-protein phosphatase [Peptococcaceae bacterium]|nr:MAG: Protein serine/threonine phosphatase [Clostridia bacterium 41_269]HBT20006.1 serine/threonine-protein phosphatase [Peptococcaceae bacterium]
MFSCNGKSIKVGKLEVCGSSIPAGKVGGDFFEFITQNEKAVFAAIGDVMGKGFRAAYLMETIRQQMLREMYQLLRPIEVVKRLNRIGGNELRRHGAFVTLFIICCDAETGCMKCVNAGHHPPILLTGGEVKVLKSRGVALGLLDDYVGSGEEEIYLSSGDALVMYTDGLVEACGPGDERYGLERLKKIVSIQQNFSAEKLRNCILADLEKFTFGYSQRDDITLVVVKAL